MARERDSGLAAGSTPLSGGEGGGGTEDSEAGDWLEDDGGTPSPSPDTQPNFITPQGAELLREELQRLRFRERPEVTRTVAWAAANGDRSENADYQYGKRRLREIDRRIAFLAGRLARARIIDPTKVVSDTVEFGATVVVRDENDKEQTYQIVGQDEVDAARGLISWASPLGHALMGARVGDVVLFRTPRGPRELEICAISYRHIVITAPRG